jgi:putative transposase
VKQGYQPTQEILELLENFRCMVNDCIRIGLKESVTSMKSLSLKAYHQLSTYENVPTYYRLTAISKAAGILRNYRRELKNNRSATIPYVTKPSLTDCYCFRIFHRLLRLPTKRGEYAFIILNNHTLDTISRHTPRSLTLTTGNPSISFSKETSVMKPAGLIGIDRNLDNVTLADSEGGITRHDLSRTTEIKTRCRNEQTTAPILRVDGGKVTPG